MALIWVHTPSVGEYLTVKPLLELLKENNHRLVITYSSPRAGDFMKRQHLGEAYIRFPLWGLITGISVKRFLQKYRPRALILVESDRYPALLSAKVPKKLIVNARISDKSFKFLQSLRALYRPLFAQFDAILCKDEKTLKRFQSLGVPSERLKVCGNLKAVFKPKLKEVGIDFPPDRRVITAGSTHKGEEEIVLSAFGGIKKRYPNAVLVIAPRHVERSKEVFKLAKRFFPHLSISLRSQVEGTFGGDILIVDTLGELLHFYKHSTVAFVGGSLVPVGGHNLLEPAYFGKPVIFGPHVGKFEDLVFLLEELGLAFPVKGKEDFVKTALGLLEKPPTPKGDLKAISERIYNCYARTLMQLL